MDLINCNEGPDTSRVHSTQLNKDGDAATLADREYFAGDQIFENYGQPNYIYFMYHGFVLDENTHDCVRVDLNLFSEQDYNENIQNNAWKDSMDEKVKKLQSRNMYNGETMCLKIDESIPSKLFSFIAIKDEIDVSENEISVQIGLLNFLEEKFNGYTTSIDEDESLLVENDKDGDNLHWHLKMAIKLRLQEKKHLKKIIQKVKDMMMEEKTFKNQKDEL